jgi:hypothetical protein
MVKLNPRLSVILLALGAKRIPIGFGLALAVTSLHLNATAQEVNLGTANNYGVLAGSTVTSTGNTVVKNGDVGVSSGTAITGFPPGTIPNGSQHLNDGSAQAAQTALTAAYLQAAGLTPFTDLTGQDLGGLTLTPGVYRFSSSAQLTGTLYLNDENNPDAVFVFQIGSTLTTASSSSVVMTDKNGNPLGSSSTPGISVFWQVGSSATLGTATAFEGNILALTSITADTGATDLDGRLLARNGAVTLDSNEITAPPAEQVPETGSTLLLLGSGLAALFAFGRRFSVLLGKPA